MDGNKVASQPCNGFLPGFTLADATGKKRLEMLRDARAEIRKKINQMSDRAQLIDHEISILSEKEIKCSTCGGSGFVNNPSCGPFCIDCDQFGTCPGEFIPCSECGGTGWITGGRS